MMALGNRIAATHGGERLEYVVDPTALANVVAEYGEGVAPSSERFFYGLGLVSKRDPDGSLYWYGLRTL